MARGSLDGDPITFRLTAGEVELIKRMSAEQDRAPAYIVRQLFREALSARGILPADVPLARSVPEHPSGGALHPTPAPADTGRNRTGVARQTPAHRK